MMRFTTLLRHPADWMSAPRVETSVVVTSRVRLARNLDEQPFPGWAKKAQRCELLAQMRPAAEALKVMKDGFSQELSDLEAIQKQVLVERHLISRQQAARGEGSAAVINRKQTVGLMMNEEDHLRLQAMRPGLRLSEALQLAQQVDEELEKELTYAFDVQWGYLTACPSNLGTAMRASVMLHLPGLALADQLTPTLKALSKLGLAVRGLYGEGTESLGNLFQVSNQSTLGHREEEIVGDLERVIAEVAGHEMRARHKLFEDDAGMVRDAVGRAWGVLRYAHLMTSKEALNLLSLLRLGADFEFFDDSLVEQCDQLFMEIQPAHLQWAAATSLSPEERDEKRAEVIRQRLQNLPSTFNPSGNPKSSTD